MLKKNLICGVLLRELVSRWDIHSPGIRVANRIIPFTTLDVCIGLGLRVVGEPVYEDDDIGICSSFMWIFIISGYFSHYVWVGSRVRQLFNGEVITVSNIVQKLRELTTDDDVEYFCTLYIILGFATFYFPRATPKLKSLPFRILDDLGSLDKYDWGGAVYKFLLRSVNSIAPKFNERRNRDAHHIAGCVASVQLWAVEHLLLRGNSESKSFPRMKDWIVVRPGKCIVSRIFQTKEFVEDIDLNDEDNKNEIVKEAIEEVRKRYGTIGITPNEFRMRISMIEDEMKVYEKADCRMASRSNQIILSQNVTKPCDVQKVETVETAKNNKKVKKWLADLYRFCTRQMRRSMEDETMVRLNEEFLTRHSMQYLGPRKWLDNYVFSFATKFMMVEEIEKTGVLTRFLFNSYLADMVVIELPSFKNGTHKSWGLGEFCKYISFRSSPIDMLKSCKMIFAPAVFQEHWVCYVLVKDERKMYILDSLAHERNDDWLLLDSAMHTRFEELLNYIVEGEENRNSLLTVYENMPKQRNNYDCGIYVLKYLELWNGENTMHEYSEGDIVRFRKEFVCKWVLHPRNSCKEEVLEKAKLPQHLTMETSLL